jgi:uncharacterized protein
MNRYSVAPEDMAMLRRAAAQFNTQAYYGCHETLEKLWLAEKKPIRNLYKGILQIAVALYHRERGNLRGARRLLESGLLLLEPFLPSALGLELEQLHSQAAEALTTLTHGHTPKTSIIPQILFSRQTTEPLLKP